jgi:hypothetical protein
MLMSSDILTDQMHLRVHHFYRLRDLFTAFTAFTTDTLAVDNMDHGLLNHMDHKKGKAAD